ncbi:ABC transporter permease [Variovorax sp. WS11]|uniref:ABC transporter permease n=1 Tax=Variovorax sp. WS11 TaxID=1105204 RepID=UPI000D0DBDF2|nr:ABC transporter permease [Variovorax sp. WS11]NDZ14204.1 ABC transporter permease [Variovorax sp. WS11]PSL81207.1 ABC transporter permease [Variovorax sp. WS11]
MSSLASTVAAPQAVRAGPRGRRAFWLIAPALLLIGVFLVLPYLNIVLMSLRPPAVGAPYGAGFTLANYGRALTDPYLLGVLGDTLLLGLTVTPICLLLGYPVAYHLARTRSRFAGVLYVLVLSPLLVGVVVRSFGWLILLSGNGVINRLLLDLGVVETGLALMNNRFGVTLALVHVFLPFMILPLVGVIQSIDPSLEQAARSLGASRPKVFRRVVLPLSWPGIQAGTILVFVLALSAYVTPVMLGGAQVKTMSVLVVQNLIDNFQWPAGAAQALLLTACGVAAVALYAKLTGRFMKGLA